jgi:hypothetical protein
MERMQATMKTLMKLTLVLALVFAAACACNAQAQEEAAGGAGELVTAEGEAAQAPTNEGSGGFFSVILASGALGVILWLALFGAAGAAVYFAVDCAITVRAKRIMPQALIDNVTESMAEGDVLKALQNCEQEPGPLANILSAGFR